MDRRLPRMGCAWLLLAAGLAAQTDFNSRWDQAIRGGAPAARGETRLPAGFTLAARQGASGQALTLSFTGPASARAAFGSVLRQVTPYFDRAPALLGAFTDNRDSQINVFFRAGYQGAPVRGLMVAGAHQGKDTAAVIFDREELFARSLPALSKQIPAALPKGPAGGAPASAPRAAPQLVRTQLTDGSGWIGLAPGWQIRGAFKGVVDTSGPEGQVLSLGGYQQVFRSGSPNSTLMFGPYRPPWPAWQLFVDCLNQHALARGQASLRLIEQSPAQFAGGEAAWLSYEFVSQGVKRRGLAYVITKPMRDDIGSWFFYSSYAGAPAERFAQDLPTMWEMWKSWSVNQAVFRERMDDALRSMRDTYRIMQEAHDYRSRVNDSVNYGWDETIRGVTMIEDVATRSHAEVGTNHADWWVDQLNRQGYQVRVVPVGELVQ